MERRLQHVLITGVTGFLGGHLAARLCREGVRVRGLGRDAAKGRVLVDRLGLEFVEADFTDAAFLKRACVEVDTVFHAGALSSPWGRRADFVRANVEGTRCVLAAGMQAGVERLVHVSTPSLYFRHDGGELVGEDAALPLPVNDYVRTKRAAEVLVQEAARSGLETVILRPRALIGAGDSSILPRLVRALEKGRLPVIGDGRNLTDLTCVENAVDALVRAATAPVERIGGRIYNITNGQPVRLWEMLRDLAAALDLPEPRRTLSRRAAMTLAAVLEPVGRLTGREPALTKYGVGVLSATQTLDISAARRDLGYDPQLTVGEGLARFVDWWKGGAAYPFWIRPA